MTQPKPARAIKTDDYFLSASNPTATADQRHLEALAMRLFETPVIRQARDKSAFLWRKAFGHDGASEQAMSLFEDAMDEWTFNYLLKLANGDGNYPRIVQNFMPAHEWFGNKVRGARIGGDNTDNIYRMIPIAHGARYELSGQQLEQPPSSVTFTLVGNYGTSKTIMTLDADDLKVEPDGSFLITIDGEPANGRPNHLTTRPDVKLLFIRDSLNDWATETANQLRVRRVTPPDAAPLSEEQMAARAADVMCDDVPLYYWFTRLCTGRPVNTMPEPVPSIILGGLANQIGLQGWFRFADDEAMVIHYDPAGAKYSGLVLQDWWFRSLSYWDRQISLTEKQSMPNSDGTRTLVVAHQDPGVYNWVDTTGIRELPVVFRWQGLPRQPIGKGPTLSANLIKLKDLPSVLPKETVMVTAAERKQQLAARKQAYARRLVDR